MSHGETHGESKDERWWVKLRDAWTIRGTWVHLVDIVKRRIEDEMRTREAQPGIREGRDCFRHTGTPAEASGSHRDRCRPDREKGEKTAWNTPVDEALKEFWDGREDKPEDDIPFDDVRWGRHLHFCYSTAPSHVEGIRDREETRPDRPPNQKQDRRERMLGQDASEQIRLQDGVRYQSAEED